MVASKKSTPLLLSHVLGALSYALDLTEGQPPGHCIRSCWIGSHIGLHLGLDIDAQWDLYYTLLLKDAGCSSNAARLCELYGTDDRAVKRDFKTVDNENARELLWFVVSHSGLKQGMAEKLRAILRITGGDEVATELIQTRCERGAAIARQLGFSERVAQGIHSLDEHWSGRGKPELLKGEEIPLGARIALLSQVADVFFVSGGAQAALDEVQSRAGTWFDPSLVKVLETIGKDDAFWSALKSDDIEAKVWALEPKAKVLQTDEDQLDAIAEAFGQVVDSKSHYTAGHSERVALYSEALAVRLGIPESRRRWLRRGALLHDLGKLGVSNAILDKPDKLSEEEWAEVRMHPVYTEEILLRIAPFHELAVVSAAHHERLDGKGYPKQMSDEQITLETRIITVADILDALTAERPYRGPMPLPKALDIMKNMVGTALDERVFQALQDSIDEIDAIVGESLKAQANER